jgi:hypothetical protein
MIDSSAPLPRRDPAAKAQRNTLARVAGNLLKSRWFLDEPHNGDRCGHRVRLALQPSVALQKALSAVLAPVGKLMGYMASYPEYSGADHLVEMHSSEDGGRRAGMIVAAVGTGIFAVVVPRRRVTRR